MGGGGRTGPIVGIEILGGNAYFPQYLHLPNREAGFCGGAWNDVVGGCRVVVIVVVDGKWWNSCLVPGTICAVGGVNGGAADWN